MAQERHMEKGKRIKPIPVAQNPNEKCEGYYKRTTLAGILISLYRPYIPSHERARMVYYMASSEEPFKIFSGVIPEEAARIDYFLEQDGWERYNEEGLDSDVRNEMHRLAFMEESVPPIITDMVSCFAAEMGRHGNIVSVPVVTEALKQMVSTIKKANVELPVELIREKIAEATPDILTTQELDCIMNNVINQAKNE